MIDGTMIKERAMHWDRSRGNERATPSDRNTMTERATVGNRTMQGKRAKFQDRNISHERAKKHNGNKSIERTTKGANMKKMIIAVALAATTTPALAYGMTYFLTSQWVDRGQRFCRYQNGTVLNVGISLCPLSIQG